MSEAHEWRFIRQLVADETGWTLADVDAMSLQDYVDWGAYREARAKARPQQQPGAGRRPRQARRR